MPVRDIAEELGVSKSSVWEWVRGMGQHFIVKECLGCGDHVMAVRKDKLPWCSHSCRYKHDPEYAESIRAQMNRSHEARKARVLSEPMLEADKIRRRIQSIKYVPGDTVGNYRKYKRAKKYHQEIRRLERQAQSTGRSTRVSTEPANPGSRTPS